MEPVSFAILLFACADGGNACTAVRAEPMTFDSVASCEAKLDEVLMRSDDIDAPWIEGECRAVAKLPAKLRGAVAKPAN